MALIAKRCWVLNCTISKAKILIKHRQIVYFPFVGGELFVHRSNRCSSHVVVKNVSDHIQQMQLENPPVGIFKRADKACATETLNLRLRVET